jgi:glutamyl-tRNA synthetase
MAENIRVRLAPSPTGKFHIGTARTALFNYLFARKFEGKFILRIEDTDKERSSDDYTKDILDGLRWLGMQWDEGPEINGPFEPYFQQEREGIYEQYTEQLLEQKKAYKCFCSSEELDKERKDQMARGEAPKYSGKCRHLSESELRDHEAKNDPYVVRFVVEPQSVIVNDLIRGEVQFDADLMGDFVIVRSDGTPLFALTNAIDDSLMEISHVFRGEEHLPNAAKQILLCQALNMLPPQYGHFPLIFNADRTKMSKRKDPVSVSDDYKAKGYLPGALVNFIALLGWNPGTEREIFSLEDLIAEFQIERVGKSPSIFDPEKLLWMNGYYIRNSMVGEVAEMTKPFITDQEILKAAAKDPDFFLKVIATVQDRMKTLFEAEGLIGFFYQEPEYKADILIAKKSTKERTALALKLAEQAITDLKSIAADESEVALRSAARNNDLKDGELLWALRASLTGQEASPGAFEMLEVLGKAECLKRIATARKKLSALKASK